MANIKSFIIAQWVFTKSINCATIQNQNQHWADLEKMTFPWRNTMKTALLVTMILLSLFFINTANAEMKLTHEELFKGKSVTLNDDHNKVLFPANTIVSITPKNGKTFSFVAICETLFDFPAGDYLFAGKGELVLTDN